MIKKTVHPKLRDKKIVEVSTYTETGPSEIRPSEITVQITVEGKNGENDCWYFTAGAEPIARSCYLTGDNLARSNEKNYKI
jgi:hypothetical protein